MTDTIESKPNVCLTWGCGDSKLGTTLRRPSMFLVAEDVKHHVMHRIRTVPEKDREALVQYAWNAGVADGGVRMGHREGRSGRSGEERADSLLGRTVQVTRYESSDTM